MIRAFVREHRWYLILFAVVIVATFFPMFQGKFYGTGDMGRVHIPLELFFQEELRAARLPAWNPDISWGYPVIAAGQIGFFYPPLLIARLLFPIWFYLPLIIILHFFALAVGMYLFLLELKLPRPAAAFGSLTFTLSAFVFQHLTHLNITLDLAYLPWQLLIAHRLAVGKISLRWLSVLAGLIALPFIVGQFQIPFFMAAFTTIYFITHHFARHKNYKVAGAALIFLIVTALALSATQVAPTLDLIQYSSRGSQGNFDLAIANQHSFPIYHLPTILFPRFFGNDDTYWGKRLEIEYGIFIGTIPLLLASWYVFLVIKRIGSAWTKRARRERLGDPLPKGVSSAGAELGSRGHALPGAFWVSVAIISFLLALGTFSPLRLIGIEPSLWVFSAPARWLLFTTLSLSVLAAYGFNHLSENWRSYLSWHRTITLLIFASVVVANFFLIAQPALIRQALLSAAPSDDPYYLTKIESLLHSVTSTSVSFYSLFTLIPLAALLLPLIVRDTWRRQTIIAVTAIELIILSASTSPLRTWQQILDPPDTLAHLPATITDRKARMFSIREGGDTGAIFTNPESRENDAARDNQKNVLVPLLHAQYHIPSIEWPASLDLAAHYNLLNHLRAWDTYLISDYGLAREINIGALLVPTNLDQPHQGTLYATHNNVNIYTLNTLPRASQQDETGKEIPAARPSYTNLTPSRTLIRTALPENSTLIVRDTWYPGWVATVDGERVPITPTATMFRSLSLPAGFHTIEMHFRPTLLYWAMGISVVTTIILTLLMIFDPPLRRTTAQRY